MGVDEVGRGCFAGPVVAAAVILKDGFYDERVIDSKKIPEKKRAYLAELIKDNAVGFGIGVVCPSIIDKINILNATKQAMHIAISKIDAEYDKIVIDAVNLKNLPVVFESHIKGEDKFIQIAAASILAKVYRDDLMKKMHYLFPQYDWYENKGYGTAKHIKAIKQYGTTPLHRISFLKGIL